MDTYVYVLDEFRKVDIDASLAKSLVSKPLELFRATENSVQEVAGKIENVELRRVYMDEATGEFVVEFLAKTSYGRISVKLIHSHNPVEALVKFYEQETREHKRNPHAQSRSHHNHILVNKE